jgi:DNA-binding MurR/RpiR family transcriptional regulator
MSDGAGSDTAAESGSAARLHRLFEGRRLTPTQRRIAHCLVRQTAEVPFLSSVELAQLAGVSQPSVTRFAMALGYSGYPALRRELRALQRASGPKRAGLDAPASQPTQRLAAKRTRTSVRS